MSLLHLITPRRLASLAAVAAVGVSVTGCATSSYSTHEHAGGEASGLEAADSNNDGAYVQANGVTYQLEISRALNPYSVEDSQYVKGLPAGTTQPTGNQLWYGVFLWAKNQYKRPYRTANNFVIEDTSDNVYYPVKLNPALNPYAWDPETLQPGTTEPGQDTTAAQGFTGGKILLFKLPTSVYSNRPLTLYILNAQRQRIASISLDL